MGIVVLLAFYIYFFLFENDSSVQKFTKVNTKKDFNELWKHDVERVKLRRQILSFLE